MGLWGQRRRERDSKRAFDPSFWNRRGRLGHNGLRGPAKSLARRFSEK